MATTRISIDFGTSNTVAVLAIPGREPRPLLFDGSPLLPSAVHADPDGRLVVGRDAWHAGASNPAGLEPFPKRHIDEDSILLGGQEFSLETVIAAVLRRVSVEADGIAGGHVATAVLTYPASWAAARRGRLEAVGRTVFGTVHLVAEPVAAAYQHLGRIPVAGPGRVLVYDLGAGTFDASVLRCTPGGVELLASTGLDDVGGLDIDAAVVHHLGEILAGRVPERWRRLDQPIDRTDQRARRHLWDNVRTAKEVLSGTATTLVHVPLFDDELPLGRESLDMLARPVLERTIAVCRDLLATADADGPLLGIFLVGGASRMPLVQTLLHRSLGVAPAGIEEPQLAVAEGALAAAVRADVTEAAGPLPVHRDSGGPTGTSRPGRRRTRFSGRRWSLAASLLVALMIAAGLWLANQGVGATSRADPQPSTPNFPASNTPTGSSSPHPSPTPSPAIDPCLVGVWVSTSYSITHYINRVPTTFTSSGGTVKTIKPDGRYIHDYTRSSPGYASVGGDRWEDHTTGSFSGRIRTVDRTIVASGVSAKGSSWFVLNGRSRRKVALTADPAPSTYLCSGNTLNEYTSNYQIEYTRRPPR
ncbi:Hsp70 family protein [Micromonosporaceae bacterium B7E4]